MINDLTYKYYHKAGSKTVHLVVHGGGPEGVESSFIARVIDGVTTLKQSVFGFNFPYCERGEENSSGHELIEEVAALQEAVTFLRAEGFEKIVIIAKSLGGIVTSYWLEQYPAKDVEVVILGYVIGSVKTPALQQNLRAIIQGELDRFGNVEAVKEHLAKNSVVDTEVIEIPQADHSYRNANKEPEHQEQTVSILLGLLK